MTSAQVQAHPGRDLVVVLPPHEIDLATVAVLEMLLAQASASGLHRVEVDLADVSFIDRRGVLAIAEAAEELRRGGRSLVVRNPCRTFLRVVWALQDPSTNGLVQAE